MRWGMLTRIVRSWIATLVVGTPVLVTSLALLHHFGANSDVNALVAMILPTTTYFVLLAAVLVRRFAPKRVIIRERRRVRAFEARYDGELIQGRVPTRIVEHFDERDGGIYIGRDSLVVRFLFMTGGLVTALGCTAVALIEVEYLEPVDLRILTFFECLAIGLIAIAALLPPVLGSRLMSLHAPTLPDENDLAGSLLGDIEQEAGEAERVSRRWFTANLVLAAAAAFLSAASGVSALLDGVSDAVKILFALGAILGAGATTLSVSLRAGQRQSVLATRAANLRALARELRFELSAGGARPLESYFGRFQQIMAGSPESIPVAERMERPNIGED